jgi:hypothetical protein
MCTISYLLAVSHKQRSRLYLPFGYYYIFFTVRVAKLYWYLFISKSLLYPLVFRNTYYTLYIVPFIILAVPS